MGYGLTLLWFDYIIDVCAWVRQTLLVIDHFAGFLLSHYRTSLCEEENAFVVFL